MQALNLAGVVATSQSMEVNSGKGEQLDGTGGSLYSRVAVSTLCSVYLRMKHPSLTARASVTT